MTRREWRDCLVAQVMLVVTLSALPIGCATKSEPSHVVYGLHPSGVNVVHDMGEVDVTGGAVRIEHRFEVSNDSREPLTIQAIRTSCGCLDAQLGEDVIAPGQTTALRLAMEVNGAGFQSHGATLVTADGKLLNYRLSAFGAVPKNLSVILDSARFDSSRRLPLRLYYVDSQGDKEVESIVVVSPENITIEFSKWLTLEDKKHESTRPTRQVANAVLDFTGYHGAFPVEIELRTARGVAKRIIVYGGELVAE